MTWPSYVALGILGTLILGCLVLLVLNLMGKVK